MLYHRSEYYVDTIKIFMIALYMSKPEEVQLYSLKNNDNYLPNQTRSFHELCINFTTIVNYYTLYASQNIINKQNKHIFEQGYYMLVRVFSGLLMYSRNMEVTVHHSQKAVFYYIEYISQITDKDNNMFFNLTIKDAVTYVYTKTIYEIPQNTRFAFTITDDDNCLLSHLHDFMASYTRLSIFISSYDSFHQDEEEMKIILSNLHILINEYFIINVPSHNDKKCGIFIREFESIINQITCDINNGVLVDLNSCLDEIENRCKHDSNV